MKIELKLILFVGCIALMMPTNVFSQTPGQIFSQATPVTNPMDPNGDGFITLSGVAFAGAPTLEENEFELNFQRIPQFETEPDSDIQTGANCSSTDILSSSVTASGHSYIMIDNFGGTDYMIFRARLANNPSGAFAYTFLFDIDIRFGTGNTDPNDDDPNAIAGNPGFEIEVVYATGGGNSGVSVYNVDGISTGGTLINSYPISSHSQRSYTLDGDVDCTKNDAIFMDFYVPVADILGSPTDQYRVASATSSSPQTALGGSASDIAGVDGNNIADDDDQFVVIVIP